MDVHRWRIIPIAVSEPAEASRAQEFAEVQAASARARLGEHASPFSLTELQRAYDPARTDRRQQALGALAGDGRVVGVSGLVMPQLDNVHAGYFLLDVLPEFRGRGVGSALLAATEEVAAQNGRTSLAVETSWLTGGQDLHGEGFAARRGYEPVLTTLQNEQDLTKPAAPGPPVDPAYVIEVAEGALPGDWLADRAVLQARMSIDAPTGELDTEPEVWTPQRLQADMERQLASGRQRVEAVARHISSGRLVAFSYAMISAATPTFAYQEDTLVLREHRGHGLGRAVKEAVAARLRAAYPQVRSIRTWNATTNTHMLAVNAAMGYRAVAFEREWQKRL